MRASSWEAGELPLAEPVAAVLAAGTLILELHHDGETLDPGEQLQPVAHDGGVLRGVNWPWSFYPGIKLTVAAARNATPVNVTTTLLDIPLPSGDQYRVGRGRGHHDRQPVPNSEPGSRVRQEGECSGQPTSGFGHGQSRCI